MSENTVPLTSDHWEQIVPVGAMIFGTTVVWQKNPRIRNDQTMVFIDLSTATRTEGVIRPLSGAEQVNQATGELVTQNGVTLGSLRDRLLGTAGA